MFGLPFATGIVSFGVFYFFIKNFINDRLKLLYRSIRKGKITNSEALKFSLREDIIATAEEETKKWAEERYTEIDRLKEREEYRKEFLGNLAHELKTPVFSIQGYILTLLEGGLEDEEVNRLFLERASKATDRIVNILEDLDQITKLEAESLHLDYKNFDIVELTKEIFEALELKAKEKGIKLKFSKPYSAIIVRADRGKIAQVLTNLLINAISYSEEGKKIKIRTNKLDNKILIDIIDQGVGIRKEDVHRIFERFYRVDKSRSRHIGGTGLGLAIVKHILDAHHQTISVTSELEKGSSFTFTLEKA